MQQNPRSTDRPVDKSSLALGEEDVRQLMEYSTPAARIYITDKIANSYCAQSLDKSALIAAEQIFRLLVRDTELKVRGALSKHLKDSAHIPRDIVKTLAKDAEEIALPVLQFSQVLNESDLLELMESQHEISRYLAVSRRKEVPEKVALALIETGNAQVATTLVSNGGAKISEQGFGKIIELHRNNESILKSVSDHPQLPVAVVEKLVSMVSGQLADSLRKKHQIPMTQINREVEATHEDQTLSLVRLANAETDTDKLIAQLRAGNSLTPSVILSALCQGSFTFFEMCLAKLSNIPLTNARTLIADRGELGFRALYNKAGLPEGLFPAVKLLLKVVRELDVEGVRPGSAKYASAVVERLLHHAERTPVENLSYVIALVRRVAK
ncbi:MAG: DUF2336 domain-containing protein [Alphaproteobacteria bacterium]|nr:DUF2336 domain-containing protein [Alphaproteobacteria bacterium]